MINIRRHLGNILEHLNRSDIFPELSPVDRGRYIHLNCPACGQATAYISQNGYYINCNRKNHCGYVNGIVEYIVERDRIDEYDAISLLAKLAHISLPEITESEIKQFNTIKIRERIFKDILSISKYGIWLNVAEPVRDYLSQRGYTDTEIISMDFGFLPVINELKKKLADKGHSLALIEEITSSFNHLHPLLIPVYNPIGTIDGFISRTILNSIEPKYLYTKGLERGSYFFNFNEAKSENTLIIVEGIIDALLLSQRGVNGAVACGGDSPTERQIKSIDKYMNIKNIVLCLDNDTAGIKGTEKALHTLMYKSLNVYIANTAPYKDPDELIKSEGIDKFKIVLQNALSKAKWLSQRILNNIDINTDIGREEALNKLLVLDSALSDPIESEYIKNIIIDKLHFSIETIENKLLSFRDKRSKELQAESYSALLKKALRLEREKKYDELFNTLKDGITKTKAIVTSNIITPYTLEIAGDDIKSRRDGLETGYANLDNYINIPAGAVTIVAGRPSHGKTSFLMNIFLNMVRKYPNKSFFYFSYEESKTALFVKIINIMSESIVNDSLKYKNTQQIEYYIKGGIKEQDRYYASGKDNPFYKINSSTEKYNDYVNEGRLWLIDIPIDVATLSASLENLSSKYDVGAVFIDYAQRVKYNGKYENERVKIARISEALRETATRLDLSLIVGAQLNRQATGKPQLDQLKEAGNLEEDANIVLGIYNWKTAISKEKTDVERKNCIGGSVSIDDRDIDFEVHILKNRNGAINETALLCFDAPILKIKDNMKKSDNNPF